MSFWRRLAAFLFAALVLAPAAHAHETQPLIVDVTPSGGGYSIAWQAPAPLSAGNAPQLDLGGPCEAIETSGPALKGAALFSCPEGAPAILTLTYAAYPPAITTIVRHWREGAITSLAVLGPGERVYELSAQQGLGSVFTEYFAIGARHFAGGWDHILFVSCLILLAGGVRRTVLAISGFTLGHSLTLALATLGFVSVPGGAVETLIAVSIVLMAREIICETRGSLIQRKPAVISAGFGLLHGLGFAGFLAETGWPSDGLFIALAGFNLGVEFAQLLFAGFAGAALLVARKLLQTAPAAWLTENRASVERAALWAAVLPIGAVASAWSFERLGGVLVGAS